MGDYIQLKADHSIAKVRDNIKTAMRTNSQLDRKVQPLYLMSDEVKTNVFERELMRMGKRFNIPVKPYYINEREDWYQFIEEVDFNLSGVAWTGRVTPKEWFDLLRTYPACFDIDGVTHGYPAVVEAVSDLIWDTRLYERIAGEPVLVIGRSLRVGMPMAEMLSRTFDAVVTIGHSEMKVSAFRELVQSHKIIVSCLPSNIRLSAGHITEGSVVIDVAGTLEIPPGVEPWFDYTPAKGCLGPLTTAILLSRAANYSNNYFTIMTISR